MGLDPKEAALALHRFGFGPRTGSIAAIASDPRGALLAELERPNAGLIANAELPSSAAANRAVFEFNAERLAKDRLEARRKEAEKQEAAKRAAEGATVDAASMERPMQARPEMAVQATPPETPMLQNFFREARAHFEPAINADIGFVERLVWFWSNHFCVSADKGNVRPICGAYEREAIRAHVLGRFGEMLLAVESHPAMLIYLDNARSIGPASTAGVRQKRGLNENLAREIMELHTLGVGGGYTQDDVTSLARIITGWTFAGRQGQLGLPGSFVFNANAHQPGAQRLLGKTYEDNGVAQGEAALADIARHPSTAKFIATKFARHFVADDPPPVLVTRLQDVFRKSDGDLRALTVALLDSDEAWQAPLTKLRSPYEFLVAAGRLLAQIPEDPARYLGGLNVLGQPLWSPAGPNGFPDSNAVWAAPEGIKLRLDISAQIASRLAANIDPRDLLQLAAADAASSETRRTIELAESRQQALALLLMSPEFQRR